MLLKISRPLCIIFIICFSGLAWTQSDTVFDEVQTPIPGVGHDYLGMTNEVVNPADGSVSVRVGVPVPPGRKLTTSFAFAYDSAGAHVSVSLPLSAGWSCSNATPVSNGNSCASFNPSLAGDEIAGWSYIVPSLGYSKYSFQRNGGTCFYYTNYTFHDNSGGHVMGLLHHDPTPACAPDGNTDYATGAPSFSASRDVGGSGPGAVSVVDADGTLYRFAGGYTIPAYVEDRNGNKIVFTLALPPSGSFTVTDNLGRTALNVSGFAASGNTVSASGLASPYTLTWGTASSNFNTNWVQVQTDTASCGAPLNDTETQPVIKAITLPNGQQYGFSYDATYGLLNQITYPTGAWVKYTWTLNPLSVRTNFNDSAGNQGCWFHHDMPAILHRFVSFDGTTTALQEDFSYSTTWGAGNASWTQKQTTITTHDLGTGNTYTTTYVYVPGVLYGQSNGPHPGDFLIPTEEQTVIYKDGSGSTLRTVTKQWLDQYRQTSESTTLDNNLTAQTTFSYGTAGQLHEKDEYDFGQSTPTRKTIINYQSFANTPIFPAGPSVFDRPSDITVYDGSGTRFEEIDYAYDGSTLTGAPAAGHDDTNYPASLQAPRGNLTTKTIKCFKATRNCPTDIVTQYTYDNTGQILTKTDPRGDVTQYSYADNFDTVPPTTNAYLTQITFPQTINSQLMTVNHVEKFKYAYSDGQLTMSTDQNNKQTTYAYNDPLRRITEIDYPITDGHTAAAQTNYFYTDNVSSPYVERRDKVNDGGTQTDFYIEFDGMGHPIRSAKANSEQGWQQVDTCYDGLGRKHFISYPFQGPGFTSTSYICSNSTQRPGDTYIFDPLGRLLSVQHSDGSLASSTYVGRAIQIKDEGNDSSGTKKVQRVLQSDGLGRLGSVVEVSSTTLMGATGTPATYDSTTNPQLDISATGFLTQYAYDVLGNILTVTQNGLNPRNFNYDSLSRLVSVTTPESGPTCYGTYDLNNICQLNGYDGNGNLLFKAAPQPNQGDTATTVQTTYQYDPLNRLISKTFSDGTPAVSYNYDETLVRGVPLTNTVGRRSSVSTAGSSLTGEVFSYDAVGHIVDNSQCTPQNCGTGVFPLPYVYDLLGNTTSSALGVFGYKIGYSYNLASLITSVTSNLIDGNHPGTLLSSSGLHYNAFNYPLIFPLGNSVTESSSYLARGMLQSIAATTPNPVPGVNPTGSITINGSEQSTTVPGTPGTGWVSVSGTERSGMFCPAGGSCFTMYDGGIVSVTVNGHATTAKYGVNSNGNGDYACSAGSARSNDTASIVESRLASAINADGAAFVTASVNGTTINLTTKATGSSTGYALAVASYTQCSTQVFPSGSTSFPLSKSGSNLTPGNNPIPINDSGTVWAQVGSFRATINFAGGSTASSIATAFTGPSAFGTVASPNPTSPVNSSVNGTTVTLVAKQTNSSYTLTGGQTWNQTYFSQPSFTVSSSGTNLLNTVYSLGMSYYGDGDVQTGNDSVNGNWSYTYDDFNRLATAVSSNTGKGCSEVYDRFGNRWQQNPNAGACNQMLLTFNNGNNNRIDTYLYDAAGNLLNDGNHSYAYDAENRLISVVDGGNTSATYVYDADGRRARKTTAGGSIDFLYDTDGRQITEIGPGGVWNRGEIYASSRHLATYKNNATYFNHNDWLRTERTRTDIAGKIVETCASLPFGDSLTCSSTDTSPLHFAGKERDQESGLDYFTARYDSSALGRFTSPDPLFFQKAMLTDPQQFNSYVFARNNPTVFIDPSGKAIQLSNDPKKRQQEIQALCGISGQTACAYIYVNTVTTTDSDGNTTTQYFVGILTNGPSGTGPSFGDINGAARQLGDIIADKQIATVDLVPAGTRLPDGAVIGPVGKDPNIMPGEEYRGSDGKFHILLLDPATSPSFGEMPKSSMSNNQPGIVTLPIAMAHEFGHAWKQMQWRWWTPEGGNSENDAIDFENKVRRLNNPNAPIREYQYSGSPF